MRKIRFCVIMVAFFITSCNSGNDGAHELRLEAELHGMLMYEIAITKYCKTNGIEINWEAVDSAYYANCPECLK